MICAENIQINHQRNPIGISQDSLYISWIVTGAGKQTAYRVILEDSSKAIFYNTGKVVSGQMSCEIPVRLPFGEEITVRVLLWDEKNAEGKEKKAFCETGPALDSVPAKWINPEGNIDPETRQRASYLKKTFMLSKPGKGRIYGTAHGIFDVYLNGVHLDDRLLMPGTTQYDTRLALQTIDCTAALQEGENELIVTLGDGWYRGSLSNNLNLNVFGMDVALLLWVEKDGEVVCATDETWVASQSGPLGENDLKAGETYDARKEEINDWHAVTTEQFSLENLIYPESVPVRKMERFPAKLITTPAGETVLDFGVNIAGFVEFAIQGKAGQKLILTHGETLDENGNFTIENYRNPAKKDFMYQRVEYVCKEGLNRYCPTKTYFGFRYVKAEGDVQIHPQDFIAVAIYSDMPRTGYFSCGNADVNQLFENALRSMKGNFVDIPTDCPTREKDGWSGDAQAFVHTAMYLMDCYDVYAKWLRELADGQTEEGKIASVAPRRCIYEPGSLSALMDGSVGWSDAIEIIPTELKKRYGDGRIGENCYEAMKMWIGYLLNLAKEGRDKNKAKVPEELWPYFIDHGFLWGEWLEPGQESVSYMTNIMREGEPEVSTAYLSYGSRLVSEIALTVGKSEEAAFYADIADKAKTAYRLICTEDGKISGDRQCRYVRPVALGLLNEEEKQAAVDGLAQALKRNENKLNTGFLTTHDLCRVLTDYGYSDVAYDLLLQTECPGWLYSVQHGATSIWETWDAVREDGSVHDSHNHYSYGAVVSWLFDSVCGIRLENGQIIICPHPDKRLEHAEAVYDSPVGRIASKWRYDGLQVTYEIEIPENCTACIRLPGNEEAIVEAGKYKYQEEQKQ